jgi:hypothetical protein
MSLVASPPRLDIEAFLAYLAANEATSALAADVIDTLVLRLADRPRPREPSRGPARRAGG